jgi:precorrin-6B methylase 2
VTREWTRDAVLEIGRSYQPACVLLAAAELDIFSALAERPRTAPELATVVHGDVRGTTILVDALVALGFLEKREGVYSTAPGIVETLAGNGSECVLAMLRHHANCLRSWAQLASVVRSGHPADRTPSVLGADTDRTSFIEAMEVASREAAPKVVEALALPAFDHLLDVGGGPATWTIAFLHAFPGTTATLYDLPEVIPIARRHVEGAGLVARVRFVAGDFASDDRLPSGSDLAWVSAIVHQNSRQENRELFRKIHTALEPVGRILIRDVVMDESHTSPPGGALFAVNMLVRTPGGGTFSSDELTEDLRHAGFRDPDVVRGARDMDWVIQASKA